MAQTPRLDDSHRGEAAHDGAILAGRVEALARGLDDLRERLQRVEKRLGEGRPGEQHTDHDLPESSLGTAAAAESAPAATPPGARTAAAAAAPVEAAAAPVDATPGPAPAAAAPSLPQELTYAGRVLLALGGAYLLRAVTETGVLPAAPGVVLGLLYGLAWAALAWRAAERDAEHSAVAHGVASAMVGFPLVWETTVRFQLLAPALGAALLLAYALVLLAVAWARDLRALAWIAGLGGFVTGVATMFGSATLPPFVAVLVVLGGAVLAAEPDRAWRPLAWASAGVTDLAVLVLVLGAGFERSGVPPLPALAALLLVPVVYVGFFGGATLAGRRSIDLFAVLQSALAVLLGVGGALVALGRVPQAAPWVGAALVLAAVAAYGLAFHAVERSRRRPFHYFGTLGTVLALAGTWLLLPAPAPLWAALVPVAAALGWWLGRLSLVLHASLFATAAAAASGLLAYGALAFAYGAVPGAMIGIGAGSSLPAPGAAALLSAAAALFALAFPLPAPPPGVASRRLRATPHLVLLCIALWGLMALAVWAGVGFLEAGAAGAQGDGPDPGWLAALRTSVLAVAAVAMAALSRRPRFPFAAWLVYPLLALGAVKLVAEDLVGGRPATLVVSFLAFGVALIVAPRLRRTPQPAATASGASERGSETT